VCHLIEHLDGKTSGPSALSGTIGRQHQNCEQKAIIEFKKIETEALPVDISDQ
jgi:hypothetical protein